LIRYQSICGRGAIMGEASRAILMVLAFGVLAAAGFFAARHWQAAGPAYQRVAPVQPCELRDGPCSEPLDGGRVSFAILPQTIPLMQTLRLRVQTEGIDVDGVEVLIRGLNMDMGLNRTRMGPAGDGIWEGETILPICSQRRMEWEAAVRLQAGSPVEIPFTFSTTRP
jgi:hypothetical protein